MMDVRRWIVIGMGLGIASCGRTSSVFVGGVDDTEGSTTDPDPSTGEVMTTDYFPTGPDPGTVTDTVTDTNADTTMGPGPGPGTATESGPDPDTGPPPIELCGDGVAEGFEICDGLDLNGQTCEALGLGPGQLQCSGVCTYDTSDCGASSCGNGALEPWEPCDGDLLAGEDCITQGFDGGALSCRPDCMEFEFSGCFTLACGDGMIGPGEACDGLDLGGATCVTLGLDDGVLTCAPDCASLETSGCGSACMDSTLGDAVGPAVAMGNTDMEDDDLTIGCAASGGADHVLGFTALIPGEYVLDTLGSNYDTALAAFASCNPASELACDDDAAGMQLSEITVPLDAGQSIFVVVDGWNGDTGDWVLNIAAPAVPPLPACAEQDLFWFPGPAIAMGDTEFEDEDLSQSCAAGGAVDYVLRFIAPSAGTYTFDTFGSMYDTALAAYQTCDPGTELACNDDAMGTLQSEISVDLALGESILLSVNGWNGNTGQWVLNITGP